MTQFRMPIPTRVALGYDEPEGEHKTKEDIASDLDLIDLGFETFLSSAAQSNTSAGVFVAYTPTITGTGWAKGDGTLSGYRIVSGDAVHVIVKFTFGASSTAGAGALGFALPVSPDVVALPLTTYIKDANGGEYSGVGVLQSTLAYPAITGAAGAMSKLVAGTPITFAVSDVISLVATYKKA